MNEATNEPSGLEDWERCTCGMQEQERTGHYPEHAYWCDMPSPLDANDDVELAAQHDRERGYDRPLAERAAEAAAHIAGADG